MWKFHGCWTGFFEKRPPKTLFFETSLFEFWQVKKTLPEAQIIISIVAKNSQIPGWNLWAKAFTNSLPWSSSLWVSKGKKIFSSKIFDLFFYSKMVTNVGLEYLSQGLQKNSFFTTSFIDFMGVNQINSLKKKFPL